MTFAFICPLCTRTWQVPEHLAGKRAACPGCSTFVQIPPFGKPVRVTTAAPAPPAPASDPSSAVDPNLSPASPRPSNSLFLAVAFAAAFLVIGVLCGGGMLAAGFWSQRAHRGDQLIDDTASTAEPIVAIAEKGNREDTPDLTKIDRANDSPAYWIQVLRGGDADHAALARERLIELGRASVLELRRALKVPDARLRLAVVAILGSMGGHAHAAIDDLIRAVGDADPSVQAAAAQSLGQLGEPAHRALAALVRASADPEPPVQLAAAAAIPKVGPLVAADTVKLLPLWKEPDALKRERWLKTVRDLKPDAIMTAELFAPLLGDPVKSIRLEALRLLAETGTAAHISSYSGMLKLADDTDAETRRAALAGLPKLGPPTTGDRSALETGLHFRHIDARLFCVEQLGQLGEAAGRCAPDVAGLLRDKEPRLRAAAARALGRIGKPAVVVLNDLVGAARDPIPEVRAAAVEALSRFGREPRIDNALFASLGDEAAAVREASAKSLRGAQPPLGRDDLPALRSALKSAHVETRRFAAAEIARLGKEANSASADIKAAINDADFEVRRHALAALAGHGPAKDASALALEVMNEVLRDDGRTAGGAALFRQAGETLKAVGDPLDALPVLSKGFKARDRAVVKEVIDFVSAVGTTGRRWAKELCGLLSEPDLATVAGETLLKLRGDEVVRALCDVVDGGGPVSARLAAVHLLGQMGKEAKDASQTLYLCSTRHKGKELGKAALAALKQIQR